MPEKSVSIVGSAESQKYMAEKDAYTDYDVQYLYPKMPDGRLVSRRELESQWFGVSGHSELDG